MSKITEQDLLDIEIIYDEEHEIYAEKEELDFYYDLIDKLKSLRFCIQESSLGGNYNTFILVNAPENKHDAEKIVDLFKQYGGYSVLDYSDNEKDFNEVSLYELSAPVNSIILKMPQNNPLYELLLKNSRNE